MKLSYKAFSQGSAWRRGFSAVAAVLVLAVLVGSMMAVFALVGHGKNTANLGQPKNPSSTWVTAVATVAPEPLPTPGIYIISEKTFYSAQVSRLDPQTRKPLWTQPVGATGPALSSGSDPFATISTPTIVVYGNTLYVVSGDSNLSAYNNYVYAIDATSGVVRWKKLVSHDSFTASQYGGPYDLGVLSQPTIAQGMLYVAARDGKLYALDAATGVQRWVYDAHASTFANGFLSDANPVIVAQGIVYGAIHNVLYALDARSGKPLWIRQIAVAQLFNAPTLVNGVLYLSSREASSGADPRPQASAIYAYASKDGQRLWQHPLSKWVLAAPTVANGVVYFGSYDRNLYALKASDGSELWRYDTGGEISEQPLVENGVVYIDELGAQEGISSDATVLFAINTVNGKLVWKRPVANMLSLEQVNDGVIYVGIWPGQLAALSARNGATLWQQHYGARLIDKTGTESEMPPVVTVIS